MKSILFSLLLLCSSVAYSQSFMMNMSVVETTKDSTINLYNTKVIWGIKQDTFAILWNNNYLRFCKKSRYGKGTAEIRKQIEEFLRSDYSNEHPRHIVFRELYYNLWGELYLITIFMHKGCIVLINRMDDKFPYYMFTMMPDREELQQNTIWSLIQRIKL